jgi:hypothetical protein
LGKRQHGNSRRNDRGTDQYRGKTQALFGWRIVTKGVCTNMSPGMHGKPFSLIFYQIDSAILIRLICLGSA